MVVHGFPSCRLPPPGRDHGHPAGHHRARSFVVRVRATECGMPGKSVAVVNVFEAVTMAATVRCSSASQAAVQLTVRNALPSFLAHSQSVVGVTVTVPISGCAEFCAAVLIPLM